MLKGSYKNITWNGEYTLTLRKGGSNKLVSCILLLNDTLVNGVQKPSGLVFETLLQILKALKGYGLERRVHAHALEGRQQQASKLHPFVKNGMKPSSLVSKAY